MKPLNGRRGQLWRPFSLPPEGRGPDGPHRAGPLRFAHAPTIHRDDSGSTTRRTIGSARPPLGGGSTPMDPGCLAVIAQGSIVPANRVVQRNAVTLDKRVGGLQVRLNRPSIRPLRPRNAHMPPLGDPDHSTPHHSPGSARGGLCARSEELRPSGPLAVDSGSSEAGSGRAGGRVVVQLSQGPIGCGPVALVPAETGFRRPWSLVTSTRRQTVGAFGV